MPPSVTPDGGRNPSFRIYEVNATTGDLVDYVQYRLDLEGQGMGAGLGWGFKGGGGGETDRETGCKQSKGGGEGGERDSERVGRK